MSFDTKLHEEIQSELEGISNMNLGTEEYRTTVDGVTKLMDRAIELKKFDAEQIDKANNAALKTEQMENEKKDSWIRNGLTAAGIIIPTIVTIWGTLKTFKFEESGTVTTMIGRGFINKLIPKK